MADKTILVTRPDYDDTTDYLSQWSEPILEVAEEKGIKCIDLNRDKATRQNFESYVYTQKPSFIVLNGHGSESVINGQSGMPLVEAGNNENVLAGSVVFARACDSAALLGPKAVEKGTISYIGYTKKFIFPTDKNKISTPLKDEIARPCFEVSNSVSISLLKGQSVEISLSRAGQTLRKQAEYLRTHYTTENSIILFSLMWNASCQKALGDLSARL